MNKTPEELADKHANWRCPEQGPEFIVWCMCKEDFVAGYQAAQQWISVKNWMPERGQKVLALGEDQSVLLLKLRENYGNDILGIWEYVCGFDQDVNGYLTIDITHWMPLPAAPKEEV